MCKLINRTTQAVVAPDDTINDQLGRPWSLFYVHGATERDPAYLEVRRITNDVPAKRASKFTLSFFPDYRVSMR